ncbi:class I SAM-dependent methyltransferase [Saccharopolyspora sp. HNM0983]|uniref:Class I SAM-dependent methyltransferase n=1 Tax=Saccharopolyspora montiporae TaxID=2781240 RepID=A0A929B943_9PSEU|nr:class I SAM-dependent methyltransferase [Saccharopolyspora sp. HNM0983]
MQRTTRHAAARIEQLIRELVDVPLPVGLTAWDGSEEGPEQGPRVLLRNRRALRHLLWQPGELGLARAFVSGDLDVRGDLTEALRRCWAVARAQDRGPLRLRGRHWGRLARAALRLGALGPRPPVPPGEARPSGRLHSRGRDRSVIAHHYDAGNAFYELLLDPQMAYSCGYFTAPDDDLEQAQDAKLDLICRKLALQPGMRLLDVGCGWGSLVLYAARRHGVRATAVTLSAEQADYLRRCAAELGLQEQVQVLHQDYRAIGGEPFDAVASVEMGEHVGADNYPRYAATLHRMLRPGGRLLIQQMSRAGNAPGGGAFIESYIAPDMTMVPIGSTLDLLESAGLEVRDVEAMREHYVRTVRAWLAALQENWSAAVALMGEQQARVWWLYLAGGALAFEENRMGVHQVVAVRPDATGASGMALGDRAALPGRGVPA